MNPEELILPKRKPSGILQRISFVRCVEAGTGLSYAYQAVVDFRDYADLSSSRNTLFYCLGLEYM
jgi:hypothetical protein